MTEQLMHGIFGASLCSTGLAILFIATRKFFARYIGSRWGYYLWFSVFVPWVFIWVPYYPWTIATVLVIYTLIKPIISPVLIYTPLTSKLFFTITNGSRYSIILSKAFFIFWIIGTLSCLSYIIFRHFQFVKVLRKNSRLMTLDEKKILSESLTSYQQENISIIYLSKAVASPMICHIVNSKIYLPESFFHYYTIPEQKYVLQHEFFHFKRRDLLANSLMLLLGCINWFNPIMFFIYRYFRNSQELSCDAMVSTQFTSSEKKAYGYALVKTVINQSSEMPSVSCWWNTGIELKERCQMLKYNHSKPIKALIGAFILISTIFTTIAAVSLENRDALFTYSAISANESDFVIKVFNNTDITQPLHYTVINQNQEFAEGQLTKGDDNGEFITINGFLRDKANAEITVDAQGKIIWQGIVIFSRKSTSFYTKLLKLDSHYALVANIFGKMHVISFDIKGK